MKIAFDPWVLSSRFRYQGTYVYAQNLLRHFKRLVAHESDTTIALFASKASDNDSRPERASRHFDIVHASMLKHDRLWRIAGASLSARCCAADLLFSPTSNLLPIGPVPVVCTIHDVTPVLSPSHAPHVTAMLRSFLWSAAHLSAGIITDSENSKKDILSIYGIPESKVSVVYLGYEKQTFNRSEVQPELWRQIAQRFGLTKPYLFHHGVIQPRKNLQRLIQAHRMIAARRPDLDLDLVLAGPLGWKHGPIVEEAGAWARERGRVIFTGALPDSEIAILIKRAALAVIPSLYEGFCLPMVEAMACGTPTLAAGTSCLPEISGGVLQYFDPESVDDIAASIERALDSDDLRKGLSIRGLENIARYNWSHCAELTLRLLRGYVRNGIVE